MRFIVRYLVTLVLLIAAFQAVAEDASSDLAALLNSVHTMQANFTQTVYDNRGKPIQKAYGHMAMQRPGKFRWEITKPIPQLIIANESRLWIYDKDLEQVTIRKLAKAAGDTPALLLSHMNTVLDQDYLVKLLQNKSSPSLRWFELTPKKADNMFASIQMGFMKAQLKQMNLKDHLGHTTLVDFENAKINMPLAQSLFIFKAPAHTDVIDETQRR